MKKKMLLAYTEARSVFADFVATFSDRFAAAADRKKGANSNLKVYLNDTLAEGGAFATRVPITFVRCSCEKFTRRINSLQRTSMYCGYARRQGDITSIPFLMLPSGLGFWDKTESSEIPRDYVVQWGYEIVTRIKDQVAEKELIEVLKTKFLSLCANRKNAEQGV